MRNKDIDFAYQLSLGHLIPFCRTVLRWKQENIFFSFHVLEALNYDCKKEKKMFKNRQFYRHMVVQQNETKVYAFDSTLMQIVVKLVSGKIYKIILVNWQQLST